MPFLAKKRPSSRWFYMFCKIDNLRKKAAGIMLILIGTFKIGRLLIKFPLHAPMIFCRDKNHLINAEGMNFHKRIKSYVNCNFWYWRKKDLQVE